VNGMTVIGYEPATGRELWRCRGMNHLCSPSAVYADGLVYAASGRNGPAMAIDPGGSGDGARADLAGANGVLGQSPLSGGLDLPGRPGRVHHVQDGHVASPAGQLQGDPRADSPCPRLLHLARRASSPEAGPHPPPARLPATNATGASYTSGSGQAPIGYGGHGVEIPVR